jgi:hypothetical protein
MSTKIWILQCDPVSLSELSTSLLCVIVCVWCAGLTQNAMRCCALVGKSNGMEHQKEKKKKRDEKDLAYVHMSMVGGSAML